MGIGDKIQHAAEEAAGKVKEKLGSATDNEDMEAEGRGEQSKANVKQAGDKLKDAADNVLGR
ncbi:CsbD family protein [Nakamurella sp. YIM 132087]|uniref:CsbD family protein n=1 Tax=Nakamurella alba TaxID=2665158 RepID=A0A7K1FRT4_9ACTN|nr:CsbD family protein [Nakamurella alba]MTD16856.1 CsbD family protein [Nakamurella alba]